MVRQFGDEGGAEVRGGGAGSGELRLQRVHQGHRMARFVHDLALVRTFVHSLARFLSTFSTCVLYFWKFFRRHSETKRLHSLMKVFRLFQQG